MKVIGISCFYHDSAVAYVKDGVLKAAAQEERFSRVKHDPSFPFNSLGWILDENNLKLSDIDCIAFYENPHLKLNRIKYSHIASWPNSFINYKRDLNSQNFKFNIKNFIRKKVGFKGKIEFNNHHLSHAASAFLLSPFKKSAILTIDGVGEFDTTTIGIGNKHDVEIIKKIKFPHSLGLLYSAFTYYCGFKINSGEYKLMGLAPYGSPKYTNLILENMIDIKADGSYRLNMKYFDHLSGRSSITSSFEELMTMKKRAPESEINEFYMDVAASIQEVLEICVFKISKYIRNQTKIDKLCMAGGVALNCVANGKLLKSKIFKDIWIQPASGDAGGALGAALLQSSYASEIQRKYSFMNPYLGPEFSDNEIEIYLKRNEIPFKRSNNIYDEASDLLKEGKIIGWFQGKSEFGPRALGNRSILGNPLISSIQRDINLSVKFRESFRPFAPIIMEEKVSEWFEISVPSPYMLLVANVKDSKKLNPIKDDQKGFAKLKVLRSIIPGVTHVDYSARIQTVNNSSNHEMYQLLKKFNEKTNCPVLINTSFNIRGEPIVLTPEDAYQCFIRTKINYLCIGSFIVNKSEIKESELIKNDEWLKNFPLD